MGVLVCESTNEVFTLLTETVVGRSRRCAIRLDDRRVSGEHARIRWTGERWVLRDLDSRNGTWLASRRLEAGEAVPLDLSSRFHFGAPGDDWHLVDCGPPADSL